MLTPARAGIAYASSLIIFLLLDNAWIALMVAPAQQSRRASVVLDRPSVPPAVTFYLLYMAGLLFFAIGPGLHQQHWWLALGCGAGYGLVAYVIYSATNLAVLRGWTGVLAVADISRGVAVSAATAAGSYWITNWITNLPGH